MTLSSNSLFVCLLASLHRYHKFWSLLDKSSIGGIFYQIKYCLILGYENYPNKTLKKRESFSLKEEIKTMTDATK